MILSLFKEFHKSFEMSRDLCRFQCFVLCISGNMFKFSCDFHGISMFLYFWGNHPCDGDEEAPDESGWGEWRGK